MVPDKWQADLLADHSKRILLNASRQSGKSQTVAAKVLHKALHVPSSLILLLSPTLRQSGELFREKLIPLWQASGRPLFASSPTQLELRLANGSRIVSLPESEGGIRGFSGVTDLVVDEASRVKDDLYRAVRPMLAVRGGSLVAMSTPWGCRGWWYEAWAGSGDWSRVKVTADQCPRITPEFLAEERLNLGLQWYRQEYECDFQTMVGALWPGDYFLDGIWYDDAPDRFLRSVLAIDCSRGKVTSDWQALVLDRLDFQGHHWLDADLVRLDDSRFIDHCVQKLREWQPDVTVIETNGAGYTVFDRLSRTLIDGSYPVCLGRHHGGTENKEVRITTTLTSQWSRGTMHLRRGSPGCRLLLAQAREFPLAEYDDALDSAQMALELHGQLLLPREKRKVKYEQPPRLAQIS